METQSRPTQEGLRGGGRGGGGVGGSGSRARGLEGLIKTVVIHSVLQWLMSAVGPSLAHGLWKRENVGHTSDIVLHHAGGWSQQHRYALMSAIVNITDKGSLCPPAHHLYQNIPLCSVSVISSKRLLRV